MRDTPLKSARKKRLDPSEPPPVRMPAAKPGEPFIAPEIFQAELAEIRRRRSRYAGEEEATVKTAHPAESRPGRLLEEQLVGLAFSGGGIRSATFNLGILQSLSRYGLLPIFDYLSTVSGGGYIGAWWSAWLTRRYEQAGGPATNHSRLFPDEHSRAELERVYDSTTGAHLDTFIPAAASGETDPTPPEPVRAKSHDPIDHLRLYSNFLTPHTGVFSLDMWRAVATTARNLFLNLLVLLPVLLALIVLCDVLFLSKDPNFTSKPTIVRPSPTVIQQSVKETNPSALSLTQVPPLTESSDTSHVTTTVTRTGPSLFAAQADRVQSFTEAWASRGQIVQGFGSVVLLALIAGSLLFLAIMAFPYDSRRLSKAWLANRITYAQARALIWGLSILGLLLVAGFGHTLAFAITDWLGAYGLLALLPGVASAALAVVKSRPSTRGDQAPTTAPSRLTSLIIILAPYLVILTLSVLLAWLAWWGLGGLQALWINDSPVLAYLVGGSAAWLLAVLLFVWGPYVIDRAAQRVTNPLRIRVNLRVTGAVLATLGALLLLIYFGTELQSAHSQILNRSWPAFYAFCGLIEWIICLGWLIDPNAVSLFGFYRARLIRAYLGASNDRRTRGSGQIGTVETHDDIRLTDLRSCEYGGPYHLINTTLNLVGSHELGVEQRKADNFVLSKHWCGSRETGYRPTGAYTGGGLTLGTAVAASGAAVAPNMGLQSSPMGLPASVPLAMLLALLNVRLGYWIANPARPLWRQAGTLFWPYYLLREFFSQTTNLSHFCYLTDGGHFDNLGLYALIERQCKYIVAVDAGADPDQSYADLARVIHTVRIDFGVNIDLDLNQLRRQGQDNLSLWHCAVGRIRYPQPHPAEPGGTAPAHLPTNEPGRDSSCAAEDNRYEGTLVYIKPSLSGDEEQDILQYRRTHHDFPHQSTLDQWFDEAQFECYRALGDHVGRKVFQCARAVAGAQGEVFASRAAIFQTLRARWEPIPRGLDEDFLRASAQSIEIERALSHLGVGTDTIDAFIQEIYGSSRSSNILLQGANRQLLHICAMQAQLMESVFVALNLDQYQEASRNQGWMMRFHMWSQAKTFQNYWPLIRPMYSAGFQRFVEEVLPQVRGRGNNPRSGSAPSPRSEPVIPVK